MRRPIRFAAILAVLASPAMAQTSSQEAVYLRIGGQPGQSNRYRSTIDVFVRGGPMAMSSDTTLPMSRITTFTTRQVSTVTGDTVTFGDVVDSATIETPAMPAMAAQMGNFAANLRGQTTTTKMDPRGKVVSIVVQNPNAGMMGGGRGMMRNVPGRNQRAMFVFPERAIRVGDTWSDSMLIAATAPEEGPTNFLASFKLEGIEMISGVRVASVSFNGTMATNGPNGPQLMSSAGAFQFDVNGRRVASFTMTLTGTMPTPQGDIPVKIQFSHALTQ